jgi:hypothetical protein
MNYMLAGDGRVPAMFLFGLLFSLKEAVFCLRKVPTVLLANSWAVSRITSRALWVAFQQRTTLHVKHEHAIGFSTLDRRGVLPEMSSTRGNEGN